MTQIQTKLKQFAHEVGVDVAKHKLDIYVDGKVITIPNTTTSITNFLQKLITRFSSFRLSCESTGTYGNLLIKKCLQKGVPISMITPSMVKSFIRAQGRFAKTDKIDATNIANYAGYFQPNTLSDQWLELDELKQLYRRMKTLKEARASNKTSLEQYDNSSIKQEIKREIAAQTKRIETHQKKIDSLVEADSKLLTKRTIMEAVKGIGRATSTTLLIHMPELGKLNRAQVSALTGLAPQHNESGMHQGKRMIRGGRSCVRTSLYMAAVVASRTNELFSGFYQKLRAKGKAGRVAIIAVARKLIIYLNTLLKEAPSRI